MPRNTNKNGRPPSAVKDFLTYEGLDDGKEIWACNGTDCNYTKKMAAGTPLPASKWAKHLCCDCDGHSMQVRMDLAEKSQCKAVTEWLSKRKEEAADAAARRRSASAPSAAGATSRISEVAFESSLPEEGPGAPRLLSSVSQASVLGKRQRQTTMDTHGRMDTCNQVRANIITQELTIFLVGCALPFTIVMSVYFLRLVKALNSAYIPFLPKVDAFRRTHLPRLFDDTVKELDAMWAHRGNPMKQKGGMAILQRPTRASSTLLIQWRISRRFQSVSTPKIMLRMRNSWQISSSRKWRKLSRAIPI